MLKFLLLFSLPLIVACNKNRIQIPLIGYYGTFQVADMYFNLSVGTPEQKLPFLLSYGYNYFKKDLYVLDKTYLGGFDTTKSSSFVNISEIGNFHGTATNGTETFNLNGYIVKGKPLEVIHSTSYTDFERRGKLGLDRHSTFDNICKAKNGDCTTFVESVVRDFEDQVFVLAMDDVPANSYAKPYTGQIIMGEKPNDLCNSSGWTMIPEVKVDKFPDEFWFFNISGINVNKLSWKSDSYARINIAKTELRLPPEVVDAMLKSYGAINGRIPCDKLVDLVFDLGNNKEIRIKPDVYIFQWPNGDCTHTISTEYVPYKPAYEIPLTALSNRCILYDYKNLGIGITDRV